MKKAVVRNTYFLLDSQHYIHYDYNHCNSTDHVSRSRDHREEILVSGINN